MSEDNEKRIEWLPRLPVDGVYPLRVAENNLQQVLLTKFQLLRNGLGFQLNVHFDEGTDAIRRREAKGTVQKAMPDHPKEVERIQASIDDVLFRGGDPFRHDNPRFAFRFASGGTLPIINRDGRDYYGLFLRDVFPPGWNIANGSTDSLAELRNPKGAIERELHEELMILNLVENPAIKYDFTWPSATATELPEFREARRLLREFLADPPGVFSRVGKKVVWLPGPDALSVTYGDQAPQAVSGLFLNINAEDFGIEVDSIGKIRADSNLILMDGEINDNRLLNRPVGLFEVSRIQSQLQVEEETGRRELFIPDYLYHSARAVPKFDKATELEEFIQGDFFDYLLKKELRRKSERKRWKALPLKSKFGLCPVTRQIIRRHLRLPRTKPPKTVFISYSHDSPAHVQRVRALADRLRRDGVDCWIDQYIPEGPDEGWPIWMENMIEWADCVLCVSTRTYHNRVRNRRREGAGLGSTWEAHLIYQELYEAGLRQNKFKPVVFEKADLAFILRPLRGANHYNLDNEQGYQALLAILRDQMDGAPPLGPIT